jgi:hypothetical protein
MKASRILMGRSDGKTPLVRPRLRCEDNIKADLQLVGWGSMDWIALARIGTGGERCECGNESSVFREMRGIS